MCHEQRLPLPNRTNVPLLSTQGLSRVVPVSEHRGGDQFPVIHYRLAQIRKVPGTLGWESQYSNYIHMNKSA